MAESEEELKSLLMKVKEKRGKADLKLNIQKTKIMASAPITSWQKWGTKMEIYTLLYANYISVKLGVGRIPRPEAQCDPRERILSK